MNAMVSTVLTKEFLDNLNFVERAQKARLSPDTQIISVLDQERKLWLVPTGSVELLPFCFESVTGFAWQEDSEDTVNTTKLSILFDCLTLSIYSINILDINTNSWNDVLRCEIKYEYSSLNNMLGNSGIFLEKNSEMDILKYIKNEIMMVMHTLFLICQVFTSENLDLRLCMQLKAKYDFSSNFRIVCHNLFVLDKKNGRIDIFNLKNGNIIKYIELHALLNKSCTFGGLCITPDLQNIILWDRDQNIHSISLELPTEKSDEVSVDQYVLTNYAQVRAKPLISAFIKRVPSKIKVAYEPSKVGSNKILNNTRTHQMVPYPECCKEKFIIEDIRSFQDILLCCLHEKSDKLNVQLMIMNSNDFSLLSILELGTPVIVSWMDGNRPVLPLILSKQCIKMIYVGRSPESILTDLMTFSSCKMAEHLSQLNGWRKISLDLNILDEGLKNRHFDTVSFYLRTQAEMFCFLYKKKLLQFQKNEDEESKKGKISQWDIVLDHVFETVKKTSHNFSEQLLQLTVNTLAHMLFTVHKESVQVNSSVLTKTFILKVKNDLLQSLIKARQLLQSIKYPLQTKKNVSSSKPENKFIDENWQNLDLKDLIHNIVLTGDLLGGMNFVLEHKHSEISMHNGSLLDLFVKVGLNFACSCLLQKCMDQAKTLIINLGFPVKLKLREIFWSTPNYVLRQYLKEELSQMGALSTKDQSINNNLEKLEKAYGSRSFETSFNIKLGRSKPIQEMNLVHSRLKSLQLSSPLLQTGEFAGNTERESNSPYYCCLTLEWVEKWKEHQWERVMISKMFSEDSYENFHWEISSQSLWTFLHEYGYIDVLRKWILASFDEFLVDKKSILSQYAIDGSLVDTTKNSFMRHVEEETFDELAKYGVFPEEVQEDFCILLERLGRICAITPEPLQFNSIHSSLSNLDFRHRLVHYCLQHKLVNLLYNFLRSSNIHLPNSCSVCHTSLLRMVWDFCNWSRIPENQQHCFFTVLSTAQEILQLDTISVQAIWKQGSVGLALGTAILAPLSLSDLTNSTTDSSLKVDFKILQEKLTSIPILQKLFTQNCKVVPDITIYHLLQNSSQFDPSKLFGWQETNVIKSEDTLSDIPHFSHPFLLEQYGLRKSLHPMYYLKQGRPGFAVLKFLVMSLLKTSPLSHKKIQSVCREVIHFCFRHHSSSEIVAGCVSFIEMLGEDSFPLRVTLHIGKLAFSYQPQLNESQNDSYVKDSDNGKLMEAIYFGSSATAVNIMADIKVEREDETKTTNPVNKAMLWFPVFAFCHIHQLDLPSDFLQACARSEDWLLFLVFAQIYQLSIGQVLEVIEEYGQTSVREHLKRAISNLTVKDVTALSENSQFELKANKLDVQRDSRSFLYARIGLNNVKGKRCTPSDSGPDVSSDDDQISRNSEIDDTSSTVKDTKQAYMQVLQHQKDFIGELLLNHDTEHPWEELLIASQIHSDMTVALLVASLFPESCTVDSLCTWLLTSLSLDLQNEILQQLSITLPHLGWSLDDLTKLMECFVKYKKVLNLYWGFWLFQPKSPLLCLLEFLMVFLKHKNYDGSAKQLKCFQDLVWKFADQEKQILVSMNDLAWIEITAARLFTLAVNVCSNSYEQRVLIRHYAFARIQNMFSTPVILPDFNKLSQLVECLSNTDIPYSIQALLEPEENIQFMEMCKTLVRELLCQKHFEEALRFAKLVSLPENEVIIDQLKIELEEAKLLGIPRNFWRNCNNTLRKHKVDPLVAAWFFKNQAEIETTYQTKLDLMNLAVQWLETVENEMQSIPQEIQRWKTEIWCYWIKVEVQHPFKLTDWCETVLYEQPSESELFVLVQDQVMTTESTVLKTLSGKEEYDALERVIGQLLQQKQWKQAVCLAELFQYNSSSFQLLVVRSCLLLALFSLTPSDLDPRLIKAMADNSKVRQKKISSVAVSHKFVVSRTSSSLSLASISSETSNEILNSDQLELVGIMERLENLSKTTSPTCRLISVCFQIAIAMNVSFKSVVFEKDSFCLLKKLLQSSSPLKYSLATELIEIRFLTTEAVTTFMCQEILNCLKLYTGQKDEEFFPVSSAELIFNPSESTHTFQALIRLSGSATLLGNKLVSHIFLDEYQEEESDQETLSLDVELCVRAHECFSESCYMEGLSRILRKARFLTEQLAAAEEYTLLVRLLTGIGRYSEMTYVFDILLENHQFELLFRKGMDKVSHLKLALLDYLKRHRPNDNDLYSMLALNFSLHREIAELLETNGKHDILYIGSIGVQNLKNSTQLRTAMQYFADAAECYVKADCLRHAQACASQAELIALQIHLLAQGLTVVCLQEKEVEKFIINHPNFSESLIVAEAYENHQSWSIALYHHVVERGDMEYLRSFQVSLGLNPFVVEEVGKRFKISTSKSSEHIQNLRKLLTKLSNVEVAYRLSNEFGFRDIALDLVQGDSGDYLQDLIIQGQVI
ncbi:spatacsin [Tachypleus tridentatus]|uniref:spatacsin n=1 Tax=Tachypleus tridentatus TaxID=6853 RepID=UPI003FD5FAB2